MQTADRKHRFETRARAGEIYSHMRAFLAIEHRLPTVAELARRFDFAGREPVLYYLRMLARSGLLEFRGNGKYRLTSVTVEVKEA